MQPKRNQTGLYPIHARQCASRASGQCNCEPTWQAWIPPARAGERQIRRNFKTKTEAKRWREDAVVAVRKGELKAPTAKTVGQAADELIAGMAAGAIRNRSREPYKPSVARSYESAIELRVRPEFGRVRLSALRRNDVQDYIDRLDAEGASASLIRNTLDPLRVIYRRAMRRDEVTIDPTIGLELPADRGRRDHVATPAQAAALIVALPPEDRALWATAFYTGMRRGELRGLRWSDLDLSGEPGFITVVRGWDDKAGPIAAKTAAGEREIPIIPSLRGHVDEHKRLSQRVGDALVFGRTPTEAFVPSTVRSRARAAWKRAGLEPIGLHEARHTAASEMRAAGLDFKVISQIIGHSSIVITQDRYTHVGRDHLVVAARLFSAHIEAAG
jgi:integrase